MCISAGYFQAAANTCIIFPFKGITEEEMDRIIQLPSKIKTGRKKKAVHEPNSAKGTTKKAFFFTFLFLNAFQQWVLISSEIGMG